MYLDLLFGRDPYRDTPSYNNLMLMDVKVIVLISISPLKLSWPVKEIPHFDLSTLMQSINMWLGMVFVMNYFFSRTEEPFRYQTF